jgi:hypothetical protein
VDGGRVMVGDMNTERPYSFVWGWIAVAAVLLCFGFAIALAECREEIAKLHARVALLEYRSVR